MCWLWIARKSGLEVAAPLIARWYELAPPLRSHLSQFLGSDGAPEGRIAVTPDKAVPASFVDDLAAGGARLRAAFPDLSRRLATIEDREGRALSIRIECEGTHNGAFFGFMLPTRRRVRFDEVHEVALSEEGVDDLVSIDIRAIVRQLAQG
jgi:predicted ester cyclase